MHLYLLPFTTISIIISSNNIQNANILVLANLVVVVFHGRQCSDSSVSIRAFSPHINSNVFPHYQRAMTETVFTTVTATRLELDESLHFNDHFLHVDLEQWEPECLHSEFHRSQG